MTPSTSDAAVQQVAARSLENYAKSSPPPPPGGSVRATLDAEMVALQAHRRRLWQRREIVQNETRIGRFRGCGRKRIAPVVGVFAGAGGAGFSGVQTCGSVWVCSVCNGKIMRERRKEIGRAMAGHHAAGGRFLFLTLTMRHRSGEALAGLWTDALAASAKTTKGAAWDRQRAALGWVGQIRVVEVTWGANGWHVHFHVVIFVAGSVGPLAASAFEGWIGARWITALVGLGRSAPLAQHQVVRLVTDLADAAVGAYLTKSQDLSWELTGSASKKARSEHSTITPWELLDRIAGGDADALDAWHEWEKGSKGRRQMVWSQHLKALYAVDEMTDEEIADQAPGGEPVAFLTPGGWAGLGTAGRVDLLDECDKGPAAVLAYLDAHCIDHLDGEEHDDAVARWRRSAAPPSERAAARAQLFDQIMSTITEEGTTHAA